jgi:hypothetical protein
MPLFSVITTIQSPTDSVVSLLSRLRDAGGRLIVAGDAKGPDGYETDGPVEFLSLDDQLASPFGLARVLPVGHYCRKNIGYLQAIAQGAGCIYETDDDNAPLPSWAPRGEQIEAARVVAGPERETRWVNVYKFFTDGHIWPRGLPLDEIRSPLPAAAGHAGPPLRAPIQQGLANGSPDVDAVWRLVLDREFDFDPSPSVHLSPGNWCPFNTQSTWWWPVVFPLLYIPSHCSFRMCDIWKSFVAQRCLWELGAGVVFHAPEVVQDRNEHNLARDFHDEIPGYELNGQLVRTLDATSLRPDPDNVAANLRRCYEALVAAGIFPPEELPLVDAWLADLRAIGSRGR